MKVVVYKTLTISKKSIDKNVDFVVQRGMEKPIPIEVSCGKKNKSQIKRAIRAYESPHGIIISNDMANVEKEDIYASRDICFHIIRGQIFRQKAFKNLIKYNQEDI